MDNRRALLKGTSVDRRQRQSEAPPHPDLPSFVSAAAGQPGAHQKQGTRCDAPRLGAPQKASRLGLPSVQRAPPATPRPMTHPGDLVARALEILAEEDEAWQARRSLDRVPRSIR